MKTVAVIPCFNEEKFIGEVVHKTKQYVDRVIVADDCSTDRTVAIAEGNGARVFASVIRRGFGGNLIYGISRALTTDGEDVIVTLDGDGQHNPDDIPKLLEVIKEQSVGIVIGSRFLDSYECPTYRKFGIDVINWIYNVGCREKIKDSQSCLRAYKREVLDSLELKDNGFGLSTEVLIKARSMGYSICEVPATCIYHDDRQLNSTMNPIKHGLLVALATIKWRLIK